MLKPIDLRFNYPILENQNAEFQELLKETLGNPLQLLSTDPTGGSYRDKEVGAKWLSQPGFPVNPDDVYLGGGGHHACIVAILAAKLQNKTIAVEEFTYSNFKSAAALLNLKLVPCKVDEFGLIPASLSEICLSNNIDALFTMATVSNPLGTVLPIERRREIVSIARENNLIIIEDDAYGFLEDQLLPNFFHLAPERSFYVYSFSKPYAQGIKTSYLLAPENYSQQVTDTLRLTSSNSSPLLSNVLNNLIESGQMSRVIREKQIGGAERQASVKTLLNGYNFSGHKNGWHVWLKLPDQIKSSELNSRLEKEGVLIVPSVGFSADTPVYEGAIRIALGGESDFSRVAEGIEIIKKLIS
ncbi:aminotransferase class I/II-fold pyridoxal phosphate-dependent enzyme [Pedobacter sp. HMF7647]|uniref:Aminotransferase class I/II-fold pyridoxal phosphate-dependent enzyme n=1 Tax=Hufsiella arboris TaxID=2695275 RepID=A0A7K1Y9F2_9SPHI|nr:PLP-dependent aminotransferase family protein [Hufsiella arboris]MXV50729.1 aminotransferase class I/II-fold pyridoxal phosphate-dependent enzyme [Hufsiella arboris]